MSGLGGKRTLALYSHYNLRPAPKESEIANESSSGSDEKHLKPAGVRTSEKVG